MSEFRDHKLSADDNERISRFQESLPNEPVNVVGLAKDFGLKVFRTEFSKFSISGAIFKKDGGYVIYANESDPLPRQRFTYAHELAHYLLHREHIGDGMHENALFRSNLSNDKEVEANKLAADILMPMGVLNELAETRKYDVSDLSKIFGVSRSSLLTRLGIPEWHLLNE